MEQEIAEPEIIYIDPRNASYADLAMLRFAAEDMEVHHKGKFYRYRFLRVYRYGGQSFIAIAKFTSEFSDNR